MEDRVIDLPEGCSSRPATLEDTEAVTAVIAASEARYLGEPNVVADDVTADYAGASDLARDSLLVFRGDRLVAEILVENARYANGTVHPDAEGLGIGTALIRWSREVVRAQGASIVGGTVPDANAPARALFLANGYRPFWESWMFEIRHDAEPPTPALPAGIRIRPFEPGEEAAVHRVIEDAFAEWESRPPTPFDEWRAWVLGRPGFEPWMLPVVVDHDEIVGTAFLIHYAGDMGWVQQIAVRADHRGRGLGRALLHHAFGTFHHRGEARTGLSTDSRTGARTLYEHVGMHVTHSFTHYASEL
ncbi:MAG TPA: GNAT family N-acetyltransferase [Actinomycetota bacterium]|nr:GNAT family N-acetyltransferase [Actinomycetota bacterium]